MKENDARKRNEKGEHTKEKKTKTKKGIEKREKKDRKKKRITMEETGQCHNFEWCLVK